MPVNILMPALSPTMEEGTLAKWHVKEGDTVSSGQVIAEIETDKATMEFEAVEEGILGKIVVPEGTTGIKVNQPIALLLEEGESLEDVAGAQPAAGPNGPRAAAEREPGDVAAPEPQAPSDREPRAPRGERIFASPLARRLAAEHGLELRRLRGSGPNGRIVKADVERAVQEGPRPAAAAEAPAPEPAAPAPAAATAPAPGAAPSADRIKKLYADRPYVEVALDGMRRTIAARLVEAKQTIPHFYLRRDIVLDPLLALRSDLNRQLEPRGIRLSVNDFVIKAAALALQEIPECNAVWAEDRILRLEPSDVAVAVAIEGGLITPVLRDAHLKSLSALSQEMKGLAARARERKLLPHEYQGGSFAVSNLGMFGVTSFDAVINPPHAAILAVGAGERRPVVTPAGDLGTAMLMSATLSVDHRVIDGATGARLLTAIKEKLEAPLAMLA